MTQASTSNDWIEWTGGECPVPDVSLIDTKKRGGSIWYASSPTGWVNGAGWQHNGQAGDIIAYRVVSA